jgi:hypothetical protein
MRPESGTEHEPIERAVSEIYERLASHELDADRATERVFALLKEVTGVRRDPSVRRTWPGRASEAP